MPLSVVKANETNSLYTTGSVWKSYSLNVCRTCLAGCHEGRIFAGI